MKEKFKIEVFEVLSRVFENDDGFYTRVFKK